MSLFEPFEIGGLLISNRFMRSATTSYYSDERGVVRKEIIDLYEDLAEGGVGLIVKGHMYVSDAGKAHNGMAGISHGYHIEGLQKITDVVHEHQGLIAAQLNHAGINSMIDRAGPCRYNSGTWSARALSESEIWEIIEDFGEAASRAVEAGFDAIQIHGAHGYLVSQFLSRHVNHRVDSWGGDLEKRTRFLEEVFYEIKSQIPRNIPVMIKLNCDDFHPTGFTLEDSVKTSERIAKMGMDMIEVSGGGVGRIPELRERARSKLPELREADFAGHAISIRKVTKPKALALVGGIRSLSTMKSIIEEDVSDIISMSRPFIREPGLLKRLKRGQKRSRCISCSACSGDDVFGKTMLRCQQETK